MNYEASQTNFKSQRRRLRTAMTKAKKVNTAEAWGKAADVAREGLESFDVHGWPDSWSEWQRSLDDAQFAQRRLDNNW